MIFCYKRQYYHLVFMNYVSTKTYDIANGTGVRVTIFVAGCPKEPKCPNCFNPETHDFNAGKEFTEEVMNSLLEEAGKSYIHGITLLGGEPMDLRNQKGLLPYVQKFKDMNPEKDIWCFTGFHFEEILKMYRTQQLTKELLPLIDVIVDGEFIEAEKDPRLVFKGSANQRTIILFNMNQDINDRKIDLMIERANKDYTYGITLFDAEEINIEKYKTIIPILKNFKNNNPQKEILWVPNLSYEDILKLKEISIMKEFLDIIDYTYDTNSIIQKM